MTFDEAARRLLQQARERGLDLEVLGERSRELTARAFEGRLDQLTQAERGGIGIRAMVAGRVGYAYSEEFSPPALDWMLEEAVANAGLQERNSEAQSTEFIPEGRALAPQDLVGDALTAPLEAKVAAALGFERTLHEDPRVKQVVFGAYAEREREVHLRSTRGAEGTYRRGVVGMTGSIVMQEGASIKQAYDAEWSTHVHSLDPGRTALDLTQRTGRLLGARPLRTGRYTAYFEPKAFTSLLAAFWPLWSGRAVVEGKSRLAGRLGEEIGSSLLTVIDDPTLPDGLASRPFDAEGTPAQRLVLVEAGRLRSYLTNAETARRLNVPNTGHAARSYRGTMVVAPSNLSVAAGSGVTLTDGVIVAEVMGVHAGANPVTGEFSVQAFGLWVEGGEVAYPVEDFAVAGDFLSALRGVSALGPDLTWDLGWPGAFGAPLVAVAGLSFAGRNSEAR